MGEDEEEAWGCPPRSPARKRWPRWWRSSSASSFSSPPSISGEGGLDLVGECEFFLHDLVGEEQGRGKECSVGEERQWGGEGALVVVERQWDLTRIYGTSSLRRRHARRVLSRTVRGRGADRPEGRVTLQAGSVQKLLPLLQLPKLIFQTSKNSTNFCVDTRNQELPILLGIGRKAIVDLK